jgi:hypothetical protein
MVVVAYDEDAELQARIWNQFMREPEYTESALRSTFTATVTQSQVLGYSARAQHFETALNRQDE